MAEDKEQMSPAGEIFLRTAGLYQVAKARENGESKGYRVVTLLGSQAFTYAGEGFAERDSSKFNILGEGLPVIAAKLYATVGMTHIFEPNLMIPAFLVMNTLVNLGENTLIVATRGPRRQLKNAIGPHIAKFYVK